MPLQSLAPYVLTNVGASEEAFAQTGPFPGGDANPLNYPVEYVTVGNGLGYVTPTPGLGLPAGSYFYHRLAAYLGDSWKLKRNFTLSYGLRYVRETGRSDSEYPAIPQLNALIPGLGNQVRQPNSNFAPQLGFAWDPMGNGKTSIRGGIGLYYENVLSIVAPVDPAYRVADGQCLSCRHRLPATGPLHLCLCPSREERSNQRSAARWWGACSQTIQSPSGRWRTRSPHSRNSIRPTLPLV